jgi:methyl-accepting chemotaxis protein
VIPAQDKYFAVLKELVAFQVSLMDQSVAKGADESSNAVNTVLVLSVLRSSSRCCARC